MTEVVIEQFLCELWAKSLLQRAILVSSADRGVQSQGSLLSSVHRLLLGGSLLGARLQSDSRCA
jgi:hypothetical protein